MRGRTQHGQDKIERGERREERGDEGSEMREEVRMYRQTRCA